jgi:hypothetical protein
MALPTVRRHFSAATVIIPCAGPSGPRSSKEQRAMAGSQPPVKTVERRIYFYRVDAGVDDGGRPLPFDARPALAWVDALPFTTDGRYLMDEDGNHTCCWPDPALGACPRLRFGSIRRSGFPQVERGGALAPLHLAPSSGLAEQVHVIFFPDGIIGAEFNFYGPRITRLPPYLQAKAGDLCPALTFMPLLRQDVSDQLERLRDVRLLRLRIHASYAARVAEADRDLGAAFRAAQRAGAGEEIEIVIRPRAYSRQPLARRLLGAVRRLAALGDLRDEVGHFSVKGLNADTGQVDLVDVLSDQLVARAQIICLDGQARALNSASAYAAIERAYGDLRPQLRRAAGVGT